MFESNSSVILEEEGDFDSIIDANHSLLIPGMNGKLSNICVSLFRYYRIQI